MAQHRPANKHEMKYINRQFLYGLVQGIAVRYSASRGKFIRDVGGWEISFRKNDDTGETFAVCPEKPELDGKLIQPLELEEWKICNESGEK